MPLRPVVGPNVGESAGGADLGGKLKVVVEEVELLLPEFQSSGKTF